ncbi:MAG: Carbamate kinase 2 [candidate division WS2 bacterium]|uniref:Carbamate kinase n=1 Tax=Psychracetigena formicireducens TaxID=2986056 RepID=A0A9E2F6U3_PSYF1|nr:Carbamate kinase 2 [Candidatus Psychracetigena formicireducens]MBT9144928.1 Carbamate kinase 2 [Candidatus Psychracetigena formicireducens]MBT9149957.1 Carbamate kinase 2 [Candidatus Psychracetigena formicireducens]
MINGKNTVVFALGGNAILQTNDRGTLKEQYRNLKETVQHIMPFLMREDVNVVVTHGNGPQVGNALLRSEISKDTIPPHTLDVCGAETQGSIGYMITQTIQEEFYRINIPRVVVSVVTRTLVNTDDPAFQNPTKYIGPFYSEVEAKKLAEERGWIVKEDSGRGFRRVVPSPMPQEIIEYKAIYDLINHGHLVVSTGGGGIPVVKRDQRLEGIEAVIDKDLASAVLATELKARQFIILTGVSRVSINFGKPDEIKLTSLTLEEAQKHLSEGQFPPGSMGPKIASAIKYLEATDGDVLITSSEALFPALKGEDGTWISRG